MEQRRSGLPEAFSRAVPGLAVSKGSCSLAAVLPQTGALGTLGRRSWVELWLVVCTPGQCTSSAPTSSSSDTTQWRPHSNLPTVLVWTHKLSGPRPLLRSPNSRALQLVRNSASLAGAFWAQPEDPSGCGAAAPSQGRCSGCQAKSFILQGS